MPTRRTFRCFSCQVSQEILASLLDTISTPPLCQECAGPMERYFGDLAEGDTRVNYGYRENRYATEESANIAKFQFTNL